MIVNLINFIIDNIISCVAIFISLLSLGFSIYFSCLQIRHNKNSVRPVSSIRLDDYEDVLAVKIKNAGTGPLTIKNLIFKNKNYTTSSLISLMPSIEQNWDTFIEETENWTISVNEELVLIRLYPENNEILTQIRKSLSQITVYLEYTDIYNTKFTDERSLHYFGRHFHNDKDPQN